MYLEERSHHDSQAIHVGWSSVSNACVYNWTRNKNQKKVKFRLIYLLFNILVLV